MSERLQMQGRRLELKNDLAGLRLKAEGLCTSIRRELNHVLTDVEEMNIALASEEMDSLITIHIDMLEAKTRIQRIDKELGLGK